MDWLNLPTVEGGHQMECSSCRRFLDEGCESPYDCSCLYECAALGGVWLPRQV